MIDGTPVASYRHGTDQDSEDPGILGFLYQVVATHELAVGLREGDGFGFWFRTRLELVECTSVEVEKERIKECLRISYVEK